MRDPHFSIVIPTYNRQDFILATLESVFAQTYRNYEIIVVDNASSDRTKELLSPYVSAGKIRWIEHDKNYERARSRNTGINNSNGDYLTFLDSDDFMRPNCLADAAAFAEANPAVKVFHNLYELIDVNENIIYQYKFAPIKHRLRSIVAGNFMSCIGNFIHSDLYAHYQFDTNRDLTGAEDWDYWMRVLADHDIGRINQYNSAILQHPDRTINNQNIEAMERGLIHLVRKFRNDEHLSEVYKDYLDRIEANSFLYLNLLANDARLSNLAFGYLKSSVSSDASVVFSERFLRSFRRTVLTWFREPKSGE